VKWATAPTAPVTSVVGQTGIITGAQIAADAALTSTYAKIGPTLANLAGPLQIPHKGGLLIMPEASLSAFRYAASVGKHPVIDLDVRKLSDGSYGNMHDATIDRTCTTTGTVSDLSIPTWKTLLINASGLLGVGWTNTEPPPMLTDILHEFGGSALFTIEVKDATTTACTDIVNLVTRLGLKASVMIQCATLAALAPAVTAGIYTQFISDSPTLSAVNAAGVKSVVFTASVTDSVITNAIAAGIDAWVYQVDRRYDRDHYVALGVKGMFTGDPAYIAVDVPMRTSDQFATQRWFPGTLMAANSRGTLPGSSKLTLGTAGANTSVGLYWLGPITVTSYTLTWTFTMETVGTATSAYAFLHLCAPDDRAYLNNVASAGYGDGYRVDIVKNGTLKISKTQRGGTETGLQGVAIAVPTDGTSITLTCAVTPTSITASIPAQGKSVTTNDTAYRGGYVHVGQNAVAQGLQASISALSIA
jgi:glycerophosphoryl diester phosphodiesterase